MKRALHFFLVIAALIAFASCRPSTGDTCTGAVETCGDQHTKLVCRHDRYRPIKCEGPNGCKVDGDKARCDFSGNKPGSPCDDSLIGRRMCRDARTALVCRDEKFSVVECKGPGGCTAAGSEADAPVKDCDTSIAKAGDDCDRAYTTQPACDIDGKSELECAKTRKFVFLHHCRGPKGCTSKDGAAQCDRSVQEPGDPCAPPIPEVCSADGVGILLCDGSRIFEKVCPGPHGCTAGPQGVTCDSTVPYEGSPCDKPGLRRCQKAYEKDREKLLECDGKKFTVSKTCTTACVFTRPGTYACKEK